MPTSKHSQFGLRPGSHRFRVPKADRNERIGFHIWIGEYAGVLPREVGRHSNREVRAIAARWKTGDDLAVIDRERNDALMGDQNHWRNGRARRVGPERDRPWEPWNPGALENIRNGYFGVRSGQNGGRGGLEPGRDRSGLRPCRRCCIP